MLEWLKDFIYPRDLTCILCHDELNDAHESGLCATCLGSIQFHIGKTCDYCGRMIRSEYAICNQCKLLNRQLDGGFSVVVYDDYIKGLLFDLKYYRKTYIAHSIAVLMLNKIVSLDLEQTFDYIVPVPLHEERYKTRGYNQSEIIAKSLSELTNIPIRSVLSRIKNTPPLNLYTVDVREEILNDAFKAVGNINGNILLIDDITTSGHTLNVCGRVLKECGAEEVYGLTFAASE